MADLSTTYLGLSLPHPLVASASPLSRDLGSALRLEDAGAAAIVAHSLFEEQINQEIHELDTFLLQGTESYAEALDYFPSAGAFRHDPTAHLDHLRRLKERLSIPLIGSLNGVSPGGWIQYARDLQETGIDALELNIYFLATDPLLPPSEIEQDYLDAVKAVREAIDIPLAVKIGPFFNNMAWMARRLVEHGADGLVLFNRFYQPDLDLERLEVVPRVHLSQPSEILLPLRWIAILRGQLEASLALTTGVHSGLDALKGLMSGADVTMMASAMLTRGPRALSEALVELGDWLEEREYESVAQLKGSMSHQAVAQPGAFERANYIKALTTFEPPSLRKR